MDQMFGQLGALWKGMSQRNRLLLVGGAALSLAVLGVFTSYAAKPDYKPLFTGMEPADVQELTSKLAAKNIRFEVSSDGKAVSVPADQLDAGRVEIASKGMPHSGRLGFELFDKMAWGQTEFDQKVNYQRALEGELERTIGTMKNVSSARVHLVMPTDSVFLDRERSAKASVILTLKGESLGSDGEAAITRLVAGAVDKLSTDDVTVIDGDTNRVLSRRKQPGGMRDADAEQELTNRLIRTIEPVVGVDRARASVTIEYDASASEEDQETYDPNSAVAVTMQRSEETVGDTKLGGVPGTSSNVPGGTGGKVQVTSADVGQRTKNEAGTYAVNKIVRHISNPSGRIRRITAAVLVDDTSDTVSENGRKTIKRRKRSADEIRQIGDLAKAAVGLDPNRGDTLTIENLSFTQPESNDVSPQTRVQQVRTVLQENTSYLRYVALIMLFLIAYALLLRPVKKEVMAAIKAVATRPGAVALAGNGTQGESLSAETQGAHQLRKRLTQRVTADPGSSSRLVQAWLSEEQS